MGANPTFLGTVEDVAGSTIGVSLSSDTVSGLAFVNGIGYRIGQIGSFVKIPVGFIDLFGIVSQVGASAIPERLSQISSYGHRWMTVQLIGEGVRNGKFKRGLSQYPVIGDQVHIVTENDLCRIYGNADSNEFINIGNISSSESIPASININMLVTRHSAIVGTTGTGKSTTVSGLLNAIINSKRFPSSRIIIFDIHGEYSKAFYDNSCVFAVNPRKGEENLFIPYWALTFEELCRVSFGELSSETDRGGVIDYITKLKLDSLLKNPVEGVDAHSLNVDTPVAFSIHRLWLDLFKLIVANHLATSNQSFDTVAYQKINDKVVDSGDAISVRRPKFLPINQSSSGEKVYNSQSRLNIRRQLESLEYKLKDPRYQFLFRPGNWTPTEDGATKKDLDELLKRWIGGENPITILDLSGIPRDILTVLIGAIIRILFDALFWSRNLSEGGRERPLLLVLEEAHTYLDKNNGSQACDSVKRIVKEGRKYGIGAMLVSQRPSEIDGTILSQCGTFFALRLCNTIDRSQVTALMPDNLEGLSSLLPILRTGEALVVGESVQLPMRASIRLPPQDRLPDSQDPKIFGDYLPGGWDRARNPEDYSEVVNLWRRQSTIPLRKIK